MKKVICLFLAMLVLALSSVAVFAGEIRGQEQSAVIITPQYTVINTIAAGLGINSSGKSTCAARLVSTYSGSNCYITMDLQKKSGSKWETVNTWSASELNKSSVAMEKYYYVVHGTYRVKVSGTIEHSGATESDVKYSQEVVY